MNGNVTLCVMSTIQEIEKAIEELPEPQIDELAAWLAVHRARRMEPLPVDAWLNRARGAAKPSATTAEVMSLTRGEE